MFKQFIEKLKQEGKAGSTLRQYQSSWNRFTGWLSLSNQTPYPPGDGGAGCRGKGPKTNTQFSHNSNPNDYQRGPASPTVTKRPLSNNPNPIDSPAIHATQLDIAEFKRWATQNYKPRTVQINLIHLNCFFRWLNDQGFIPDNPCQNIEPVTVQQTAPRWLNRTKQNALIRVIRNHGNRRELAIVTLMLHTGLRVQELCNLRLTDIQIGERKGTVTVQNGKGGKYREVPLNLDARKVSEAYLEERGNDGMYLFPSQRSPKTSTRAIQLMLNKYRNLTGIEVTPHTLRHTFCHELVVRKVPLDVIARLAGHSKRDGSPNIAMVTRYTLPSEDDLARAVEELSWL